MTVEDYAAECAAVVVKAGNGHQDEPHEHMHTINDQSLTSDLTSIMTKILHERWRRASKTRRTGKPRVLNQHYRRMQTKLTLVEAELGYIGELSVQAATSD